jgi:phosphate transport system substrate-binding protein
MAALLTVSACGQREKSYIKIKGSETVLPISLELAERFSTAEGRPAVSVTAGGSGVGIAALLEENTDIAMASRAVKFKERMRFLNRDLKLVEVVIAYDALAVIVHPDNPVDQLSLAQLKQIYTGEVTNWKAVGGRDEAIVAFNRESSSGTYGFFQKKVLGGEKFGKLQSVGANGELVEKVRDNTQSIGYVGIAYTGGGSKAIQIVNAETGQPVAASMDNAMDKTYPLTRPLFYYFLANRTGKVSPVIDFMRSQAGQELVMRVGYPPNMAFYRPGAASADTTSTREAQP